MRIEEVDRNILGLYREPGLPSPTIMALEGIEPNDVIRGIWEQHNLLSEYDVAREFKRGLDRQPTIEQIMAKTRLTIAAG